MEAAEEQRSHAAQRVRPCLSLHGAFAFASVASLLLFCGAEWLTGCNACV